MLVFNEKNKIEAKVYINKKGFFYDIIEGREVAKVLATLAEVKDGEYVFPFVTEKDHVYECFAPLDGNFHEEMVAFGVPKDNIRYGAMGIFASTGHLLKQRVLDYWKNGRSSSYGKLTNISLESVSPYATENDVACNGGTTLFYLIKEAPVYRPFTLAEMVGLVGKSFFLKGDTYKSFILRSVWVREDYVSMQFVSVFPNRKGQFIEYAKSTAEVLDRFYFPDQSPAGVIDEQAKAD